MKKKILMGSILAVALLTLVSFSSVVGKVSLEPVPDLDCDGEILIIDVKPNSFITGSCEVINAGEPDSLLNWEIQSYPDWGTWTFNPESGTGLEEGGIITIDIEIIAPCDPNSDFIGEVTFINSNNPSDFCIVDIQVTTELKVKKIRELVQSIDLRKIIVNPDDVVDTLEEVSTILEEEDVRNYIEKTSEEDCGCEEDVSDFEWFFPMICTLLLPAWTVAFYLLLMSDGMIWQPAEFMAQIGSNLNCYWKLD